MALQEPIRKALDRDRAGLERDPFFTIELHRVEKSAGVSIHVRLVEDYVVVVGIERDIDQLAFVPLAKAHVVSLFGLHSATKGSGVTLGRGPKADIHLRGQKIIGIHK